MLNNAEEINNVKYGILRFKSGTFDITPLKDNMIISQIFVVGRGADGGDFTGGSTGFWPGGPGGEVTFTGNNTIDDNPITIDTSTTMTFVVGGSGAYTPNTATVLSNGNTIVNLSSTTGGGSTGTGTQNCYTQLYYGGAGGRSSLSVVASGS